MLTASTRRRKVAMSSRPRISALALMMVAGSLRLAGHECFDGLVN
jgi:hypothetical protein